MTGFLCAGLRRFSNTVIWSIAGWRAAWSTEKTLRQWAVVNIGSAALAPSLDLTPGVRALMLALGLLVLATERLNTAIEEVIDYISTAESPHAKKAKDCGSAGVALAALAAGVAWMVVLVG